MLNPNNSLCIWTKLDMFLAYSTVPNIIAVSWKSDAIDLFISYCLIIDFHFNLIYSILLSKYITSAVNYFNDYSEIVLLVETVW